MGLAQEDICFIKENMGQWLADMSLARPPVVYEIELRERIIRVEEALRHQGELMQRGFDAMDKRFEAVDKRFEVIDKRFEAMQAQMDKRFEAVDKRFEAVDKRFEAMQLQLSSYMKWSFATIVSVGGLVVAAMQVLK